VDQIGLPFDWPAAEQSDSFIVTDANRGAVDGIDAYARWPVRAAILTGPRKSGRSLLGRIFAAKTGGTLIDDGEMHREADIFHRWNLAQEERRPLLIIALQTPPEWKIRLPDLASRLAATPMFSIADPDDQLCSLLLEKQFNQRGLHVSVETLRYITSRLERSYVALMRVVDMLDSASLSRKRSVTTALVRDVLAEMGIVEEF
jgi:hypothetical protein